MKKILINGIIISFLVAPLVGFAQFEFTTPECRIRHDLSDYDICCAAEKVGEVVVIDCLKPGDITGDIPGGPFRNLPPIWDLYQNLADCCLIDKVLTIGDYVFVALLIVGIIFILLAAWGFLTSAGEPDKVKKARSHLLYSVIGIGVAFLAKALVRVVAGIIGY